ncbi:hypothetical protein LINPERPRIM_LOCUS16629 [Linum perenne]
MKNPKNTARRGWLTEPAANELPAAGIDVDRGRDTVV